MSEVLCLAFGKDNIFLATGSQDTQVRVYDTVQCKCLNVYTHHTGPVRCLAFSPDSRWLFTGSDDGKCVVVDIYSNKIVHTFTHSGMFIILINY